MRSTLISKRKLLVEIISNLCLIFAIVIVAITSFFGAKTNVINTDTTRAIYRGNPNNKNISLMINVYWGTEYIQGILDVLASENVTTTFFVGGVWASKNEDILKRISDAGHEIANHGFNHKDHDKLSGTQNKSEIEGCHDLIKEILDIEMNLFAPPSGSYSDTTIDIAEKLGYKTIMWSKDTIDWRDKDAGVIFKRATTNLQNGDLILMHPTEKTLSSLEAIIKSIKTQGFSIVNVTKNIS